MSNQICTICTADNYSRHDPWTSWTYQGFDHHDWTFNMFNICKRWKPRNPTMTIHGHHWLSTQLCIDIHRLSTSLPSIVAVNCMDWPHHGNHWPLHLFCACLIPACVIPALTFQPASSCKGPLDTDWPPSHLWEGLTVFVHGALVSPVKRSHIQVSVPSTGGTENTAHLWVPKQSHHWPVCMPSALMAWHNVWPWRDWPKADHGTSRSHCSASQYPKSYWFDWPQMPHSPGNSCSFCAVPTLSYMWGSGTKRLAEWWGHANLRNSWYSCHHIHHDWPWSNEMGMVGGSATRAQQTAYHMYHLIWHQWIKNPRNFEQDLLNTYQVHMWYMCVCVP